MTDLPSQEVKKVETRLEEGKVSLTNLSSLQGFIRRKEKTGKIRINQEEKKELISQIENLSTRQCQEMLVKLEPELMTQMRERERIVSEDKVELKITVSKELLERLKKIQELRSHVYAVMTYAEIIEYMTEITLNKIDPNSKKYKKSAEEDNKNMLVPEPIREEGEKIKPENKPKQEQITETKSTLPAQEVNKIDQLKKPKRLAIPTHIKRAVWRRDRGCCTYISPITGKQCLSTFGLEFEHKVPVSKNGLSDETNITLHCRKHNIQKAIEIFGI
ncbi:MAG: HNH endonuclease, partial [Bdellovibrio sp.]|nr:HNH endonuclease [Bdellovibrio sp.]